MRSSWVVTCKPGRREVPARVPRAGVVPRRYLDQEVHEGLPLAEVPGLARFDLLDPAPPLDHALAQGFGPHAHREEVRGRCVPASHGTPRVTVWHDGWRPGTGPGSGVPILPPGARASPGATIRLGKWQEKDRFESVSRSRGRGCL